MTKLKQYAIALFALLSSILAFCIYFITRKNKEIDELEAEIDLSIQTEKSKQVDKEVGSAQVKIDTISQEINKPMNKDGSDEFWKDYGDKK